MNPSRAVLLDWDETIANRDGSLTEGAKEAIEQLKAAGNEVHVWTAVTNPDRLREIHQTVAAHGLPIDSVISNQKPPAAAYVDNHAIHFKGDWNKVLRSLIKYGATQLSLPTPKLHMLIGLPGSGKSTFCEQALPEAIKISHDKLVPQFGTHALATEAERAMCRIALSAGRDVILDRLNLSADRRLKWISLAEEEGAEAVGYFWDIGTERQWLGNMSRPEYKHVDHAEFVEMAGQLEHPTLSEGYTELFNVISDELGFRELRPALE